LPDEEGYFVAARLTPPSYPFVVTQLQYTLLGNYTELGYLCSNILEHQVAVEVSTAPTPDNDPETSGTLIGSITVPAGVTMTDERLVEINLEPSDTIVLQEGQHIFISVELAGTDTEMICLGLCMDNGIGDRNYWSNSAIIPYSWVPLESFGAGYFSNFKIEATGYPAP
jgi:hypothetical protein